MTYEDWEGAAAESAKTERAVILKDIAAHSEAMHAVMTGCSNVAFEMRVVKKDANQLVTDATEGSVSIDPETGTVTPTEERGITYAPIVEEQLTKLLAKADLIDANFATSSAEAESPVGDGVHNVPSGFCLIGHNPDGSCRGHNQLDAAWKYAQCLAAVGVLVSPGGKFLKLAKMVGGKRELVKLIMGGATKFSDLGLGGKELLAELLGVKGVKDSCF